MKSEFKKFFSLDKSFEHLKVKNDVVNTNYLNKNKIIAYMFLGVTGFVGFRTVILMFSNKSVIYQRSLFNLQLFQRIYFE